MERNYESLRLSIDKAELSAKQYLVYTYLISKSKWDYNKNERHYYIYKNDISYSEIQRETGICRQTVSKIFQILVKESYLQEHEKFYLIRIPQYFIPLDVEYLKLFYHIGTQFKSGGLITPIYCTLVKYFYYQKENGSKCEVTINQLRKMFFDGCNKDNWMTIKLFLEIFRAFKILDFTISNRSFNGKIGQVYTITNYNLKQNFDIEDYSTLNAEEIIKAVNTVSYQDIAE